MNPEDNPPRASAEIRAGRCPICGGLADERFRPFCSKHCADVDLSRWLNGVYAVPVLDEEEGGGKPDPSAADRD